FGTGYHDAVLALLNDAQTACAFWHRQLAIDLDVNDDVGAGQVVAPPNFQKIQNFVERVRFLFADQVIPRDEGDRLHRAVVGWAAEHAEGETGAAFDQGVIAPEILDRPWNQPSGRDTL